MSTLVARRSLTAADLKDQLHDIQDNVVHKRPKMWRNTLVRNHDITPQLWPTKELDFLDLYR